MLTSDTKKTVAFVFCCNAWKIILVLLSSLLHSKKLCDTTWYFEYFILVISQYWQQTWLYKIISTEISYKWIKEMLWKNADHSLLSWIFCSKLCKCSRVSNCPLSSLEQFLALIPLYISFKYSIENGFKLPLRSVNVTTVLNHSLYLYILFCCFLTYCHIRPDFVLLNNIWVACCIIHFM